mgnify:FL=1
MAILEKDRVYIKVPYNANCIAAIKNIPTRRWHPELKQWSVEEGFAPKLAKVVNEFYPLAVEKFIPSEAKVIHNTSVVPYSLTLDQKSLEKIHLTNGLSLFPFQETGIAFLQQTKGKALIADEMGLGKSAEALIWISITQDVCPVLCIVPASLKRNWEKEIDKWLTNKTIQIIQNGKDEIISGKDFYIINYDLLQKRKGDLEKIKYRTIILDECHYIKERASQRTKVAMSLAKSAKHIIGLTGTPILNRPKEMFNILNLISPGLFPSWWSYGLRYCGGHRTDYGWDFNGATNLSELRMKVMPLMIRREKKDVLHDLPDKRRETIYVDMLDELKIIYKKTELELITALKEFKTWKKEQGLTIKKDPKDEQKYRMVLLAKLNYLRQIVGIAKAKQS